MLVLKSFLVPGYDLRVFTMAKHYIYQGFIIINPKEIHRPITY